ncbi:MFS transporter [Streptomyces sp. NPDC057743]|uniref:MFS transporter n=1 Tax=Streptomyces sp. NPDC057743 TaxID=3346236 RepID=UPI0036B29057
MPPISRAPTAPGRLSQAHRAGFAGLVGTTVEWYDFFIFTTSAGLVFPKVFFPAASSGTGVLASFATLWVGFVGRPLGAVIFGHIGDRHGRRRSLVTSLLLMGSATTAIGLLPGHHLAGTAAPVLLCALRLVQGIAVGGEWGGAVLLAGEHAPKDRRPFFTAYAQQGTPLASVLASAAFLPFSALGDADFLTWGWRIPFLGSAVLMAIGLAIRLRVTESPEFASMVRHADVAARPVRDTLRRHSGALLLCVGVCAIPVAGTYLAGTFVLSWATEHIGFPRETVLTVVLCAAVARFLVQPAAALAARRAGTGRVFAAGLGLYLLAIPANIVCLGTGSVGWIAVGVGTLETASAIAYAVVAALLVDAFPARVRYTGISLAQQLAGVAFGGTAPALAQGLAAAGHGCLWPVAGYQALLVAVSACCLPPLVLRARRTPADHTRTSPTGTGAPGEHGRRPRLAAARLNVTDSQGAPPSPELDSGA